MLFAFNKSVHPFNNSLIGTLRLSRLLIVFIGYSNVIVVILSLYKHFLNAVLKDYCKFVSISRIIRKAIWDSG